MAVYMNDLVLDSVANYLIANGSKVHLLSTYSNVYATITAAGGSMGSFVPTFGKANNTATGLGRLATVAAATGTVITTVVPTTPETLINYAIVDDTNSTVLYVGNATAKVLNNGDTVSTPAFSVRILDAVTV